MAVFQLLVLEKALNWSEIDKNSNTDNQALIYRQSYWKHFKTVQQTRFKSTKRVPRQPIKHIAYTTKYNISKKECLQKFQFLLFEKKLQSLCGAEALG